METDKIRNVTKVVNELGESGKDLQSAVKGTMQHVTATKKLWREGNKSKLIKIGVACIMFPDPSPVGEIIGAGFIVAGLVQKGIQKRTLYIDDLKKTLESTLRELNSSQSSLRT